MNTTDIRLPQVAQKLASDEWPLADYINHCLSNIEAREAAVCALLPEANRREHLLREADALCKKYPNPQQRPPLFGILVGVKDLFHVDGFATRAGSALPSNLFSGPEAAVVSLLKNAGALMLGKTVTTEFAFMEPGPTRNPHNLKHTPGGSSSGSAAAIACHFCSLSLGTQTIGSISRPAAYCGVVGFKPSYEQISRDGVVPFSHSADHIGFFTHSVAGAGYVAPLLCRNWSKNHSQSPLQKPMVPPQKSTSPAQKPVLGIPQGAYLAQTDSEALQHFETVVARLEQHGYPILRIPLFCTVQEIETINLIHRSMITAELAEFHRPWFSQHENLYRAGTRDSISKGLTITKDELRKNIENRFTLREQIQKTMLDNKVDLWIAPSAVGTAPEGLAFTGSPVMNLPWTHAGLPTISIPSGIAPNNLPYGLQIIGAFQNDAQLLTWSEDIETQLVSSHF